MFRAQQYDCHALWKLPNDLACEKEVMRKRDLARFGFRRDIFFAIVHYNDVIMNSMASQITGVSVVYSTVVSDADQRKHQSSASLAFVWGIHRWPVNSPHKRPMTRKMFPFDDVIMPHGWLARHRKDIFVREKWSSLCMFHGLMSTQRKWPGAKLIGHALIIQQLLCI